MITDVHTHFWTPEHQGPPWADGIGRVSRTLAAHRMDHVTAESYARDLEPAQRSIVFGLQAQASGIVVPNDEVAAFVRKVGGRTGTSPLHPLVLRVLRAAERLGLPVMIHQGAIFVNAGRLADSVALLLDDAAIAFPDLKIAPAARGDP